MALSAAVVAIVACQLGVIPATTASNAGQFSVTEHATATVACQLFVISVTIIFIAGVFFASTAKATIASGG
jgi:hypothetical protein